MGLNKNKNCNYNKNKKHCTCNTPKNCGNCREIDYIKSILIPILILVIAWIVTGADGRYHPAALIFLILSLCFIAVCTW